MVLKAPDVPSVLVELGYVTNKEDLQALVSTRWRDRTADAIVQAIDAFFTPRLAGGTEIEGRGGLGQPQFQHKTAQFRGRSRTRSRRGVAMGKPARSVLVLPVTALADAREAGSGRGRSRTVRRRGNRP